MTPPALALWLLRRLLPRDLRDPIGGDLEEEWNCTASPSRRRFWSLALRSIAMCWLDRLRPDGRRHHHAASATGDPAMQSLLQDIKYGFRLMWRNPGFTAAAVATLALGIGANSAIFSIVNVLALKPLPYHEPSRVAFVLGWDVEEGEMRFNLRAADLVELQRQTVSFDALSAYTYVSANLTGGDIPDRVQAYRVTPNTFPLLGVDALLGRTFADADIQGGRDAVAVISHGLWQRRFGSDPAIVGRQILVNGEPREVVGVMPPRFEYPVFNFKGDVWLPWVMRDAGRGEPGATDSVTVVGRLRPGVAFVQAQAELDVLMKAAADRYPGTNRGLGARVVEMGKLDDEQAGPAIVILLATVSLVLILACANVANLLLARGVARSREIAVRSAIGASRLRIGRQLLVEGVLLAIAGGACGVALSVLALDGIRALLPEMLLTTVPNINELGVDRATLGYTLAVSLLTSAIFGVLPTWRASRDRFEGALEESASAGGSRATRRLRSTLVVGEVALATILLVSAGLLARSYGALQRVSPGFEAAGVLTMAMTLPDYKYEDADARRRFFDQLIDRVGQLPGVSSAGLVNVLPFSTYNRGTRLTVAGAPVPEPGREPSVSYRVASAGYHRTMGIPLVSGRLFDGRELPSGDRVVIVNQALAGRYLCPAEASCAEAALGRRIRLGGRNAPWQTVVGVVGDVHHDTLTEAPDPEVYVPMSQAPASMMMLAARTTARPGDLVAPIRAAVLAIDPAQPIYHVKPLETLVSESTMPAQTSAQLVTLFSALALVLAAVGIYGVLAYGVSQQTREFGVRMALGATPRDVLRQVLRHGGTLVALGIACGLAAALGVTRLLAGVLVGVSPSDPVTYLAAASLLAAIGLAACAVPAWRASATEPVTALRGR
ncbi:MAG: ABC transporter permease [Vicinamibacterales bacterium]